MLKDFRAYQLAKQLQLISGSLRGTRYQLDQLHRATMSALLNLSEGTEKGTIADRARFYRIAMGSVRECQAILEVLPETAALLEARKIADRLGGTTFRLCEALNAKTRKFTTEA